jgi:glycosyltransferase involved in cell wall biosynthesis
MKPLAIIGPVYPYRSAIAYCTGRFAEEMRKRFDVDLVSFHRQFPGGLYPGESDRDDSLRDRAPAGARYTLDILNPLSWIREGLRLRRRGVEVVVLVWWVWVWAVPYLLMLRIIGGRPRVVVQCHNIDDKEPGALKTILANAVFRRADLLVVHSKKSVAELEARLGPKVVAKTLPLFLPVISVGTRVPSRDEARHRLGFGDENVALFFGFIRPYKGLDLALRAWKEVDTAILVVAGEVWFDTTESVRELVRREGVGAKVRLDLRYIPEDDAAAYFAAADVVVAPYRYENQSAVAMNAFHFGKPVIATRVGGLPDIVEDGVNGILAEPDNPHGLAAAVNHFFWHADREQLSLGARAAAEKYSWPRYGSLVAERILAELD